MGEGLGGVGRKKGGGEIWNLEKVSGVGVGEGKGECKRRGIKEGREVGMGWGRKRMKGKGKEKRGKRGGDIEGRKEFGDERYWERLLEREREGGGGGG